MSKATIQIEFGRAVYLVENQGNGEQHVQECAFNMNPVERTLQARKVQMEISPAN